MTPSDTEAMVGKLQSSFKESTEAGLAKASAVFTSGLSEATAGLEKTQTQMKEQVEKAMKKAEELTAFGQGTVEAMMKSSQIWSTGVQDLGKQVVATAQTQMNETVSTFRTMTGLRSLKDVMDLQANFARASMEKAMSETSRLTDASFKLAEEAWAPLTSRVSLAVETLTKVG